MRLGLLSLVRCSSSPGSLGEPMGSKRWVGRFEKTGVCGRPEEYKRTVTLHQTWRQVHPHVEAG
jgi:hypothetical protein